MGVLSSSWGKGAVVLDVWNGETTMNNPYELLLNLSRQTGWPTSYKQDLTEYDRVLDEFKPTVDHEQRGMNEQQNR